LSSSGISALPIFQAFTPANVLAHDDDYFVNTNEELFLYNLG
jgi:hypothetical protein